MQNSINKQLTAYCLQMCKAVSCVLLVVSLFGCGSSSSSTYLTVTPSTATVGVGKTQLFAATYYDDIGRPVAVSASWSVAGDIGTIVQNGTFTGTKDGTGQIAASYQSKSATASVVVTSKGTISGTLYDLADSNKTIPNMRVYLVENDSYSAVSDSKGNYNISQVTGGTYTIKVDSSTDYLGTYESISVVTSETLSKDIYLMPRLGIYDEVISPGYIIVSGKVKNSGTTECQVVTVTYTFNYTDESGFPAISRGTAITTPATITPEGFGVFYNLQPVPAITDYYNITRNVTYK